MARRYRATRKTSRWDHLVLECNCAGCGDIIPCGTKKEPLPAARIHGRPYCNDCYRKKIKNCEDFYRKSYHSEETFQKTIYPFDKERQQ